MTRSDIIKTICKSISSCNYPANTVSQLESLLVEFTNNRLDENEAMKKHNLIIKPCTHNELVARLYGKTVYFNLLKIDKGEELTKTEVIKLLSSIITHSCIQHDSNNPLLMSELGISDLCDLIKMLDTVDESNKLTKEETKKVKDVLIKNRYIINLINKEV